MTKNATCSDAKSLPHEGVSQLSIEVFRTVAGTPMLYSIPFDIFNRDPPLSCSHFCDQAVELKVDPSVVQTHWYEIVLSIPFAKTKTVLPP